MTQRHAKTALAIAAMAATAANSTVQSHAVCEWAPAALAMTGISGSAAFGSTSAAGNALSSWVRWPGISVPTGR